ncbi:sigma-70 family RNA polymerase sigma factor [Streptomyces sp. NPDC053493]|uniref:sigma-70 family RNA polymerase sigma factor n=1 Tax=Streptomyces sp. NPDC053493 TaxID=3365705 RepID=UPI0037D3AE4C
MSEVGTEEESGGALDPAAVAGGHVGTGPGPERPGQPGRSGRPLPPTADWGPGLHHAFWSLHAQCHDRFLRYARYDLRCDEAAEAAVDATFVDLMRLWPRVAAMDSPVAYAWKVLKHRIVDQGRRRRRTAIPVDDETLQGLLDERAGGIDPFDALAEKIALHEALARLPERQREAVTLCYLLGQTTAEAAEMLGIDAATVRSHLSRALQRLGRALGMPITRSGDGKASS